MTLTTPPVSSARFALIPFEGIPIPYRTFLRDRASHILLTFVSQELDAAAKGVDFFGQDFKWLDSVSPRSLLSQKRN